MRGLRWLILVAIAAILGVVGLTYRLQQSALRRQAPPRPKQLDSNLSASLQGWHRVTTVPGQPCPTREVGAGSFSQSKDNSSVVLNGVELKLYKKDCGAFDLVRSAKAIYYTADQKLYSEGDVEITLGHPVEGTPTRKPVVIRTSGVTVESVTGKATTDRPTQFEFQNGSGSCVGAAYDPTLREVHMNNQVEINWQAPGPHARPMKVESNHVIYKEAQSEIWLPEQGKLTRQSTVIETGPAVVALQDDVIRRIDAQKAHGTETYPDRRVEYRANDLWVHMNEAGVVQKIEGQGDPRLVSTTATGETTVSGDRVDMDFAEANGDSTLTKALATGHAAIESKPKTGEETRVLRSETIELKMRPGGREIETVETRAPGTLEFLPNRPVQHYRKLEGDGIWMVYGPQNRIESFRATNARTRTEPTEEERKRKREASLTASRNLKAYFDPKTSQMLRLEQWDDFTYEEGERRARAAHATLEQTTNLVLLDKQARVWDSTGSTSADRIRMDQRTGTFVANGNVNSSRLPEKDQKKAGSGALSGDQPLQAIAQSMTSRNRERLVHYEGNVVLWQGANRIHARQVDIDRGARTLVADGSVVSQFVDEQKSEGARGRGGEGETRRRGDTATRRKHFPQPPFPIPQSPLSELV